MKTDRSNLPSVSKEPSACPGAGGVFVGCAVDTAPALPLVSIQTTFANESLEVLDRVTMSCTSSNQCNQQYSITAVTTLAGAITERYAYLPYGELAILNSSATPITSSAIDNRYTYTGREWDSALKLYHFRARMMSPVAGRFLARDPAGYKGSPYDLYEFLESTPLSKTDPNGLETYPGLPKLPVSIRQNCYVRTKKPRPGHIPETNECSNPITGNGVYGFAAACNAHDVCYGTCGSDRGACDSQFLRDMQAHCMRVSYYTVAICYAEAYTFYSFVRRLGFSYWDNAQDAACSWREIPCPCPMPKNKMVDP